MNTYLPPGTLASPSDPHATMSPGEMPGTPG
jgi:hypothetical protein